jgi:hypothetical protein
MSSPSEYGNMDLNRNLGMISASVYSLFMLSCVGSVLATGCSPFRGILPTVCQIKETEVKRSIARRLYDADGAMWIKQIMLLVEVNLRPTISRPVCLGVRLPSGTCDQFFFLFEISLRQLQVCYFVALSLTRRRVCNLLYNCFCALPEQSLLGRSSTELTAIFYCLIWDSPNLEGQVPVFISPRNRVPQL